MMAYIFVGLCMFFAGFLFHTVLTIRKCDGDILMYEDELYLELSEDDVTKLSEKQFAILNVRKVNFKGLYKH